MIPHPQLTVSLSMRIEVSARGSTPIRIVAKLVNVEAMRAFSQSAQFALNGDGGTAVGLGEVDNALDDVAGQHANCLQCHVEFCLAKNYVCLCFCL